jgi:hypothetical protein
MPKIFIFTAANAKAQENLGKSIENPVENEKVFDSFAASHYEELERIRDEGNGFYAWGRGVGRQERTHVGADGAR